MRLPVIPPGRRWIELALDQRCNLRCVGCRSCVDDGTRIETADALAILRRARASGATSLWIGGGEPTLRDDLFGLVRVARALGFTDVAVQTNGMRLSYPAYVDALVGAGTTEIRLNMKSVDAAVHDRASGRDGAHALAEKALALVLERNVRVAIDVLLARSTVPTLAATVDALAARGVGEIALWLLFAGDVADAAVAAEVPRFADVAAALAAIQPAHRALIRSFHTPPCVLPREVRAAYFPARELALTVVDAGGAAFPLESSPFEGGRYVAACERCVARPECAGVRDDYLRLHGDAELVAIDA